MGLGFGLSAGAGGMADALRDAIKQKLIEQVERHQMQMAEQRLAENARQADQQHELGKGHLGVSEGQLGLSRDRFGQDVREYDDAAPLRGANLRLIGAQTGEIQRKPMAESADRAHDVFMAGLGNKFSLGQIGARGSEERRTNAARPTGGDSGQFTSIQQGIGPDGKPAVLNVDRRSNTATPVQMPPGYQVNRPSRPVTGSERQTLNFFNRMLQAERDSRAVEHLLTGRDLGASDFAPGWMENWLKTPAGQKYTQAQRTYTEARLRKESGAAVPPEEYESDRKTAFRVSGDLGPTWQQKRGTRLQTLKGIGNASGRALEEYYGEGVTLEDLLREFGETPRAPGGAVPDPLGLFGK